MAIEQHEQFEPSTSLDHTITKMILARHSTRAFLPNPVPSGTLEQCLNLAQDAPSNSSIQPWRVTVVQEAALKRLEGALLAAAEAGAPQQIAPIPETYEQYRSKMGHSLYGESGYNILRGAKDEMEKARLRNYSFFGAPMAMIICMDSALAPVDTLSVGLYLQTLCLLLQERGLGNCIQVSVAGYPDIVRGELGIAEHMHVLCGVAVGYEDDKHHVNSLRISRDEWAKNVTFVKD